MIQNENVEIIKTIKETSKILDALEELKTDSNDTQFNNVVEAIQLQMAKKVITLAKSANAQSVNTQPHVKPAIPTTQTTSFRDWAAQTNERIKADFHLDSPDASDDDDSASPDESGSVSNVTGINYKHMPDGYEEGMGVYL